MEIEAADDFILAGGGAAVTELKFIGILTAGLNSLNAAATNLEIYRVFPKDSQSPPDNRVPTRVNSPSDVAFAEVGPVDFTSMTVTQISPSFTALNSVKNGINPLPNVQTNGEGPVTGAEFLFDVVLSSPLVLPADHFFFVPQIGVNSGDFYWLSASRPIVAPGHSNFAGFAGVDSQRQPRSRLAAHWDGHRRRQSRADVQHGVRGGRRSAAGGA